MEWRIVMKNVCLITSKTEDEELVKTQRYMCGYRVKCVVYDARVKIKKNAHNIIIRDISKVKECVKKCDAVYVSKSIEAKYPELMEWVKKEEKEILNIAFNYTKANMDIESCNIPIVVMANMDGRLHRLELIKKIQDQMKKQEIKVVVISTNKYSKMYGFEFFSQDMLSGNIIKQQECINSYVVELCKNSKADMIIWDLVESYQNPYAKSSLKTDYMFFLLNKVFTIDYLIFLVAINVTEDFLLINKICAQIKKDAGALDVIIVDNIILDTSKNYNSIEEELSAIETQYVPEVNHFSLGNKEDKINMRRIYDIKENIGEDILNKLSYKEQEYFVI